MGKIGPIAKRRRNGFDLALAGDLDPTLDRRTAPVARRPGEAILKPTSLSQLMPRGELTLTETSCKTYLRAMAGSILLAFALQLTTLQPTTPPPGPPPVADPYFTFAFDPQIPAMVAVDNALSFVKGSDKRVLLVMGSNHCRDSAYFANIIDTPRFAGEIARRYRVLFVDVDSPQTGQGRNLDVAQRFGFETIKGTPTVAILDADGHVLNRKAAPKWRNAASRTDDEIYAELMEEGEQ